MTDPEFRLETVHDVVQAWQDGVIGYRQAARLAGCDGLSELYAACFSSGVSLRTTLLPEEEKSVATVAPLIAEALARKPARPKKEEEMHKRKAITLIIPDAGPLITLAIADRLELLQSFGRPVIIMDVVKEECLHKSDAPEYPRLKAWFEKTGENQMRIMSTPFLTVFKDAARQRAEGGDEHATQGLGDATIAWFVANISRFHSADDIGLVLTEDASFGDVALRRDVHVLSTRAWLHGLENAGVIPSAADVIAAVQANGRSISRYAADRPAVITPGTKSDWIDQTKKSGGS